MNNDYIPFGEEWKKEVSKFSKKELINWLASSLKENVELKEKQNNL